MAEKFDPGHAHKLEKPERLVELPPARLIDLLELSGSETLIDFGAGTGMYSLPLADALPGGLVLAVDEQPKLLDLLRDKLRSRTAPGRVEPVVTQDDRVPLEDGVADRMLMINVLHHVYDEPDVLAEIPRLLVAGGLLVAAEFARMDRPVGPSNAHVLPLSRVRATITGLGLEEIAVYPPGEVGRYHNVIVAKKPER